MKTRSGKSHYYLGFQNGICPREIKKPGFSNWSDFWRVFRELRFREHERLKGHSQLWDRAYLDTSFLTLKKVQPNLESKFI